VLTWRLGGPPLHGGCEIAAQLRRDFIIIRKNPPQWPLHLPWFHQASFKRTQQYKKKRGGKGGKEEEASKYFDCQLGASFFLIFFYFISRGVKQPFIIHFFINLLYPHCPQLKNTGHGGRRKWIEKDTHGQLGSDCGLDYTAHSP
jgi:hypothetical protein